MPYLILQGRDQMFDHSRVVLMAFTPTGAPADKTLVTEPAVIHSYQSWRATAVELATVAEAVFA